VLVGERVSPYAPQWQDERLSELVEAGALSVLVPCRSCAERVPRMLGILLV